MIWKNSFIVVALIGLCLSTYLTGYSSAEKKYKIILLERDNEHKALLLETQKQERLKYEQKMEKTLVEYRSNINAHAQRMRQLERKLESRGDLDSVYCERDGALQLAVEGEKLLKEADRIINSMR